ncbi:MAG: spore cortex biosynthesis protein YabQ [Candidatus Spyradocola sp.]
MLFETLGQARVFLAMVACGAAAGVLYDLLRLARAGGGRGAWLPDALFALAAGALLFLAMARVQLPGLRAYVLLGAAVGWFLYDASVSRFFHYLGAKLRGFWRKKTRADG